MDYTRALAVPITPTSGPIPPLVTLKDASRAITTLLPRDRLRQPHWLRAGWAVRAASLADDGAADALVRDATEALVGALETEGWLSRRETRLRAP